jgi:hypothetical protein
LLQAGIQERDTLLAQIPLSQKELDPQCEKVKELEKVVKTMQNDKAVLQAGIDARESKLTKMAELQVTCDSFQTKATKSDLLQSRLDESKRRYQDLEQDMSKAQTLMDEGMCQLDTKTALISELQIRLTKEEHKSQSCRLELEAQQLGLSKLKAERNSYKQKGDSLAKEIAKVCRSNGREQQQRTINDVCKILAEDASRRQEVLLLREQKRKALEELEQCRIQYNVQAQVAAADAAAAAVSENNVRKMPANLLSPFKKSDEQLKLMKRNVELERLLTELSEYVAAKEMQLGTLKQVNETLQMELSKQAALCMSKNLKKGDV